MNKEIKLNVENKIVMAFTDPVDGDENPYKYFTDNFTGEGVHTCHVFNTPEEFIQKWLELDENPEGMWYWVLDDGDCICSGAYDPCDIDGFKERWGESITKRYDLEQEVREYVMSDIHKLEDYSDIEICCVKDYEEALKVMDEKISSTNIADLESFSEAINRGTVDYMTHGCR